MAAIFLMMAAAMLHSCSNSTIPLRELSEIDSIGIDRPDSALTLIERFDTRKLSTPADSALFYLISAELRDKNYYADTIDTPIRQSVRFYRKSNDKYNLMRSLFYQGEILRNKGQLGDALLAEMEAADAFQSYDKAIPLDWVYGKKIFTGISEIYENTGDRVQKMEYAKKAYEMAAKSDSTPFINDATLWYAATLSENSQVHGSVALLKKLLGQALTSVDTALVMETASHLGNAYLWDRNFREARHYLSFPILLGKDSAMTDRDINFLLWSMIEDKAPLDSIRQVREKIGSYITDDEIIYDYHLSFGNYNKAFHSLKRSNRILNNQIVSTSRSEAAAMFSTLLNERRIMAEKEASLQKNLSILIVISTFLTLVLVVVSFLIWIRRKNKKISELVYKVAILGKTTPATENHYPSQRSEILSSFFSRLDSLYSEYYRIPSNHREAAPLVAEMETLIESIHNDSCLLGSLEKEIDQQTENLLSELYRSGRRLNENQRRLIVYLYFNLSVESICVLFGINTEVFYNRKSRLKNSISHLSSPRKKELLDLLFPVASKSK